METVGKQFSDLWNCSGQLTGKQSSPFMETVGKQFSDLWNCSEHLSGKQFFPFMEMVCYRLW
jgi:hypothetical protein